MPGFTVFTRSMGGVARREQAAGHEAPGSLTLWDIAPDGRVLLTRDEERRAIVGVAPGTSTERDLSWLDQSGVADITPDGRWLLGRDRFGVYVREPMARRRSSLD